MHGIYKSKKQAIRETWFEVKQKTSLNHLIEVAYTDGSKLKTLTFNSIEEVKGAYLNIYAYLW